MRRADEARYREVVARARAQISSFDEERVLALHSLLERLLGADRLDAAALAQLEDLVDGA